MANVMGFLREQNTSTTVEQNSIIVPKDFRHSYAVGQTGCGKTSSFIYPNLDDRIKNGYGIMLFDYKGIEANAVRYFADKYQKLDDIIEIGTPIGGEECNIIQYMNVRELKAFTMSLMSLSSENDYWSVSGSNLVISIRSAIKSYLDIVNSADNINNKKSYENLLIKLKLPLSLTFSNIANICNSVQGIASFLKKVTLLSKRYDSTTNSKIESWAERHDADVVKNKFLEIKTKVMKLQSIVKNELKPLEVFRDALEESNRSTSLQTMVMAMSTTFSSVSSNKMFNSSTGIDVAQALDEGKIIIIHAQELSSELLSHFTGSVLQELSKRTIKTDPRGISIFIDEAQRVLSKEVDLHVDILRSSNTELFLTFQNYSLMNQKLEKEKFMSIVQNLSTSVHFMNKLDYEDLETSALKTFEYYIDSKDTIQMSTPMFLDENDVYDIQLKYQKMKNVHSDLNISEKYRNHVVEFNSYLYQKNQINIKAKDGTLTTINLRDKKSDLLALKSMDELITNHKAFLQRSSEGNSESLSDLFTSKVGEINKFMKLTENHNA